MITELVIEPIRTDITADGPADVRPLRLTVSTVGPAVPAMQIAEMTDAISVLVAVIDGTGPIAETLADIQTRIAEGSSTPVLASHLDALGLRDAVEEWARTQ
jgi:hypothetical protein